MSRRAQAPRHGDAVLALGLVSAVAVAGVGRLFADGDWIVPAGLAVVGAHGIGALSRRWPTWRSVLAHTAGVVALLAAAVGPGRLVVALGDALSAFRAAIVPAPTTPELTLWAVAGAWLCVGLADRLARRRPLSLAPVLPLAVMQVVATVLGADRYAASSTFAFAAAVAFYAARSRVAGLPRGAARVVLPGGPARSGGNGRRPRPVFSGAVAALMAGAATLALGPLVPGAASAPLVDVHALRVAIDVSRVGLNPLVDIRRSLLDSDDTELFTVRSPAPAYWRLTALDSFDGTLWSVSRPALHRRTTTRPAGDPAGPPIRQEFRIGALDSPWLPAAHRVLGPGSSDARLDPVTDSLVTAGGSREVSDYVVESQPVRPGGEAVGSAPVPENLSRYLALPEDFPDEVVSLARQFTSSASSPRQQAFALQDSMRLLYAYDTSVPPGHSTEALAAFLLERRAGYCEQFAGAFAAMARSLGLPARVAVGFIPGSHDREADLWRVRSRDAHAWPEVYLEGAGWTAFEPTPGRVPTIEGSEGDADGTGVGRLAVGTGGRSPVASRRVLPGIGGGEDAGPGGRPTGSGPFAWWWPFAAMLGVAGFVSPGAKWVIRQARRSGGPPVPAAWREALDRLAEAGLCPGAAETPLEFAGRVATVRPPAGNSLTRLATMVNGYAYGPTGAAATGRRGKRVQDTPCSDRLMHTLRGGRPHGADPGDAGAWSQVRDLRAALDDEPWPQRLRRRLDPRPLVRLAHRSGRS